MEYRTLESFGPKEAFVAIKNHFLKYPDLIEDKYGVHTRDLLTYGTYNAETQWALAIRTKLPDKDKSYCYICSEKCSSKIPHNWDYPEVEHLLPSSFAFLTIGLPGEFNQKWHKPAKVRYMRMYNAVIGFQKIARELQEHNFTWCHKYCNGVKSDSIFIDLVRVTSACKDKRFGKCLIKINNGKDIRINEDNVELFVKTLTDKNKGMALDWKRSISDNYMISEGTKEVINYNIQEAFDPLVDKLRSFNIEINDDRTVLDYMIMFNLQIGICIIKMNDDKEISDERLDHIVELYEAINRAVNGRNIMEGGVLRKFDEYLLTEEEFNTFLKLGDIIKKYTDIPYPGKEEDDIFIKNHLPYYPYQEEPEVPEVPEVPLRINVPQRMNVMNNRPATPARLATPRVATPTRTKRSRNNNVNENQNNMRNENYISKTLALKKPRVTRNFRPNRRAFAPLGQIAGKYKKTRKHRK